MLTGIIQYCVKYFNWVHTTTISDRIRIRFFIAKIERVVRYSAVKLQIYRTGWLSGQVNPVEFFPPRTLSTAMFIGKLSDFFHSCPIKALIRHDVMLMHVDNIFSSRTSFKKLAVLFKTRIRDSSIDF